jgi:hypothetical protein
MSAFPGLTAEELTTFEEGQEDFEEVDPDYQQFNANGVWFQPFVQTRDVRRRGEPADREVRCALRDAAARFAEFLAGALVRTAIRGGRC